jgi:hypothetical protein
MIGMGPEVLFLEAQPFCAKDNCYLGPNSVIRVRVSPLGSHTCSCGKGWGREEVWWLCDSISYTPSALLQSWGHKNNPTYLFWASVPFSETRNQTSS